MSDIASDRELELLRKIEALLIQRERLSAGLCSIIARAPSEKPKDNSYVDAGGGGYFSDDPDDHFNLGIEHGEWSCADIAREALTRAGCSVTGVKR